MLPIGCWGFVAGPGRPGATPKESSTGSFHNGSLKRSASFVDAAGTPAQQPTLLMCTESFLLLTKHFHIQEFCYAIR